RCTKVIDLRGRTAVPGLIDNHNHIVLLGLRPGFDTRLETASSIAEVQAAIKMRAKTVPAGGFITAMGGWNQAQFAEKRLPSLAELDLAARTIRSLFISRSPGPRRPIPVGKRSLRGRASRSARPVRSALTRRRWPPWMRCAPRRPWTIKSAARWTRWRTRRALG